MSLVVERVQKGWLRDRVRFRATEDCKAHMGCMLGIKVFWLNKGQSVTLKMPRRDMWEQGDTVKYLSDLITSNNQTAFNWDWERWSP